MPTNRLHRALQHLQQTLCAEANGAPTDGHLLACFVATRDEQAFADLVRRHGPMVLGVCRRLLRHQHDAEDAFQATFLVLACKAAAVLKREAVGSFLYIIAYRTALRARKRTARLRAHEKQVDNMPHPEVQPTEIPDWKPFLDRELSRLNERYRAAIVLCDLEGRSRAEAARQLGIAPSTLSSRLHRARILLAKRLGRYRLGLPAGALASVLAGGAATATVPAGLAATLVKGAALVAAGQSVGASTPAILMKEVLRTMLMTKLKGYLAAGLAAVLLSVGMLSYRAVGQGTTTATSSQGTTTGTSEPARPLTEMEELRREIDILKLQVELLQNKVRTQGVEIHALKVGRGSGAVPAGSPPSKPGSGGTSAGRPATSSTTPFGSHPGTDRAPDTTAPGSEPKPQGASQGAPGPATRPSAPLSQAGGPSASAPLLQPTESVPQAGGPLPPADPNTLEKPDLAPGDPTQRTTSPEEEAEAAIKALRAAPPNSRARQEAVKALERALQQLKRE